MARSLAVILDCPWQTYLEERGEDHSTRIAELKSSEQLWQDLVAAEILGEGVQIFTQVLEELLLLCRLFDLVQFTDTDTEYGYLKYSRSVLMYHCAAA